MNLSAAEIISKHYQGHFGHTRVVRMGKINKCIAFEVRQNNGPYTDYTSQYLFFVRI